GLQSHKPALVDGIGLIVGIDRFMSEARALTNFAGNAVATVLIGTWTKEIDKERVHEVLAGRAPFDERTLLDDHAGDPAEDGAPAAAPATGGEKDLAKAGPLGPRGTAPAVADRRRTSRAAGWLPPASRRSAARVPGGPRPYGPPPAERPGPA